MADVEFHYDITAERERSLNAIDEKWRTREQLFFMRLLIAHKTLVYSFLELQPSGWKGTEPEVVAQVLIEQDDHEWLHALFERKVIAPSVSMAKTAARIGNWTFLVFTKNLPTINEQEAVEIALIIASRQRFDHLVDWLSAVHEIVPQSVTFSAVLERISQGYVVEPAITLAGYTQLLWSAHIVHRGGEKYNHHLVQIAYKSDSPLFYHKFRKALGGNSGAKELKKILANATAIPQTKLERILYWYPEVAKVFEEARMRNEQQ